MEIRYPATIEEQSDGSFLVTFVDLHDTFTEGKSREEALFNASEVLSAMLAWRLDSDMEIPAPSRNLESVHDIAPDAKTQAAMLLRLARGERSLSDLARALETSWPAAKRLETRRTGRRSRPSTRPPLHWASGWC